MCESRAKVVPGEFLLWKNVQQESSSWRPYSLEYYESQQKISEGITQKQNTANVVEQKISRKCQHIPGGAIKIAEYIVDEIKRNVRSDTARLIRHYIDIEEYNKKIEEWVALPWYKQIFILEPKLDPITASAIWLMQVKNNADWDHKPKIRARFRDVATHRPIDGPSSAPSESFFHKYKDYDYFYDVWSNIHYGYVGLSVGFSSDFLLLGSNLEQIVTDLFRSGAASDDTQDDVTAINIGFALYEKFGKYAEHLTAQDVLDALEEVDASSKMSYSKQLHWCWHPDNPNRIDKPEDTEPVVLNKFSLSDSSKEKLQYLHPDLRMVVELAISITETDFTVSETKRTVEQQRRNVARGASQTMNSKHLPQTDGSVHAVDIYPIVEGRVVNDWRVSFLTPEDSKKAWDDVVKAMKTAASRYNVSIEWGGDWKTLVDGPHYEIAVK